MVQGRWWVVTQFIYIQYMEMKPDSSVLVSLSCLWQSFILFFCKLQITVYYSVRGGFCLTLCHKTHISVMLHWQLFSAHWSWARVTTRSPLLTSPSLLIAYLGKQQILRRDLDVINAFHLIVSQASVLLGTLNVAVIDLCRHNALFLWPVLVFSPIDTVRCQTVLFAFKNCDQLDFTQVDSSHSG